MKKLNLILHSKFLYFFLTVVIFLACIFTFCFPKTSKLDPTATKFTGKVIDFQVEGDLLKITLQSVEKLVGNYYFSTLEEKNNFLNHYHLGDEMIVTGVLERPKKSTVPNLFDYQKYLERKKIFYLIKIDTITKIKDNDSFFYSVKNFLIKRIENFQKKEYFYAFLLGDTSYLEDEVLTSYQENGISHLLAISGMHISFLSGIILAFLKKLKIKESVCFVLTVLFLFCYMILSGNSPSVCRAVLFFTFLLINHFGNLQLSSLQIFFFTFAILVIKNPFILWEVGFQFSFLVSFTLLLLQDRFQKKNYFSSLLLVSLFSFLVGFPISIFHFYQVNPISIILNLFFVPLVSILIFPLTFFTFFFSFLEPILNFLISILENASFFAWKSFSFLQLIWKKPDFCFFCFYYICFFGFFFFRKKFFLLLGIGYLILYYFQTFLFPSSYLMVIDVGQGDSILVHINNQTMLIDTGGKISFPKEKWQERTQSSLAENTIIPLLKSLGIRKLDYLVLTHGDFDHMGEAIPLVQHFPVKKVILNRGEYNDLELALIQVLENKKIPYYKNILQFSISDCKMQFLNTRIYDNENDNSNVIYFQYNHYQFLLMGDASKDKEQDLLNQYSIQNVDFLKVGHHGSKTSSSEAFMNRMNPKYSIISVGKNNRYGHPNEEVLENLSNSKIYRTDLEGSIFIKIQNQRLNILTYAP